MMRIVAVLSLEVLAGCGGPSEGGAASGGGAGTNTCIDEGFDCICGDQFQHGSCVDGELVCPECPMCASSSECPPSAYCAITEGLVCGAKGTCTQKPAACQPGDPTIGPVCGCDGAVYDGPCAAAQSGAQVAPNVAGCTTPSGHVACHTAFCDGSVSYCVYRPDAPHQSYCASLPPACAGAFGCACIAGADCGNCQEVDGGLLVTCLGM